VIRLLWGSRDTAPRRQQGNAAVSSNTHTRAAEGALSSELGAAGAQAGPGKHSHAHHDSTKPSPAEAGQQAQPRGRDRSPVHRQNPPAATGPRRHGPPAATAPLNQAAAGRRVSFQLRFASDDSFGLCLCPCTVGLCWFLLRAVLEEGTAQRFSSAWHSISHAVRNVFNTGAP